MIYYLGLGANLGEREQTLRRAIELVKKIVGGTPRNLIETVAQDICEFLLRRYFLLDGYELSLNWAEFAANIGEYARLILIFFTARKFLVNA